MIDANEQARRILRKLLDYGGPRIVFITRFNGGSVRTLRLDATNSVTECHVVGIYDWRVSAADLAAAIEHTARGLGIDTGRID